MYFPARKAPGQEEADGLSSRTAYNEVIAYACMERKGPKVTLHYGWSSGGRLNVAVFNFRLIDCATGDSVEHTIRSMTYPRGTDERSAHAVARFTIPTTGEVRPHLYGAGEYERSSSYFLEGGIGRFNAYEEPKFLADGVCR